MSQSKMVADIAAFTEKFNLAANYTTLENGHVRHGFMQEELGEFLTALNNYTDAVFEIQDYEEEKPCDPEGHIEADLQAQRFESEVDMVDAICDLMYFALGTLELMGVDADAHWDAVHAANMEKVPGINKKREWASGHDMIKPEGWVSPTQRHVEIMVGEDPVV